MYFEKSIASLRKKVHGYISSGIVVIQKNNYFESDLKIEDHINFYR